MSEAKHTVQESEKRLNAIDAKLSEPCAADILRRLIPYFVQCEDCWGDGCDECNQDGGFFELTKCINDGTQKALFAWRDRDKFLRNKAAIEAAQPANDVAGNVLAFAKDAHALNRARMD